MDGGRVVNVSLDDLRKLLEEVNSPAQLKKCMKEALIEMRVVDEPFLKAKLEMTFGVTDCEDPEVRERTRKDAEFIRKLNERHDVNDLLDFVKQIHGHYLKAVNTVSSAIVWAIGVALVVIFSLLAKDPEFVSKILHSK